MTDYPTPCDNCDEEIASIDDDMANPDDPSQEHICRSCSYALGAAAETAGNHNIDAQEKTVSALYDFARRLGHNHESAYPQIGSTLKRIVKGYGFNVADIQ